MAGILVATDFSERSDRAEARAALIGASMNARLHLLHVVDDDQRQVIVDKLTTTAQQMLHEDARRLQDAHGLICTTEVALGDPFEGIIAVAEASSPDLVVLGAHRRRGLLRDVLVGTTAQRVIRRVGKPVLMVNAPPERAYSSVMLGTDLSEASRAAVVRLADLGLAGAQDIILLHVFETLAEQMMFRSVLTEQQMAKYRNELKREANQMLAEFSKTLPPISYELITRDYDVSIAATILATASQAAADLIVVASEGRADLKKTLLGSIAEEVLRRADCDVLVIPPLLKG